MLGRILAAEAGPSDVVVDRFGSIQLGPQVNQHEVSVLNRSGTFGVGSVVGVATIGVDSDDWTVYRHHAGFTEAPKYKLCDSVFAARSIHIDAVTDLPERLLKDRIHATSGFKVHVSLGLRPARLEILHQRSRRDYLDTKGAHKVDGSRIHQRDNRNHAVRGKLHRDAGFARKNRPEVFMMQLPARIDELRAGQAVEPTIFDGVNQLGRITNRRNPVVPAPRDVPAGIQA